MAVHRRRARGYTQPGRGQDTRPSEATGRGGGRAGRRALSGAADHPLSSSTFPVPRLRFLQGPGASATSGNAPGLRGRPGPREAPLLLGQSPALEPLKDPRGRQRIHEVAEHVGRRPYKPVSPSPDKEPAQKNHPGPRCAACLWQAWGALIFRPPPHNAADQGPSQRCSQTQAGSRSVPGVSARGYGDLGFNRQELPRTPGPEGQCLSPRAVTSGPQPGSSQPEDVPPPVAPEARVRTHGMEGSPQAPGAGTLPASPALGAPGLMSASPSLLAVWLLGLCAMHLLSGGRDPRPPPSYKDGAWQSGPQDHPLRPTARICRDPSQQDHTCGLGDGGAAPHVREPPASRESGPAADHCLHPFQQHADMVRHPQEEDRVQ